MRVSDFFRDWLASKRPDLDFSTYEAYVIYLERHIIPFFDELGKELAELRPLDIKAYVTAKRTGGRLDRKPGGLSAVSVRKHLNIIKQAFREAVVLELITHSPADPIRLSKRVAVSPPRFISLEDARAALRACEGHSLYPLVCVTLYYGLRRSEVLGLRWDAIDFDKKTVRIKHTVVKASTIRAKDSTKTVASNRTFPLLSDVEGLLLALRHPGDQPSAYVFHRSDGSPLRPDSVTRGFQRLLRRAGLPHMRFHDLRHATATVLFDKGWSVPDVQHWLGHTDIETTMNIYVTYCQTRPLTIGGELGGLFRDTPKR